MRRAGGVMVALGLVLAGAACGDGGSGDEVAVVDHLDLLSAVEEAGSARISFRLDDDGASYEDEAMAAWRTSVDLEGVAAFGESRTAVSGHFEMEAVPPPGAVDEPPAPWRVEMEMRAIGEESWTRQVVHGEQGPWVREPTSDEVEEDFEVVGERLPGEGAVEIDDPGDDGDPGALSAGPLEEGDSSQDPFGMLDPTSFDPAGFVTALRDGADTFTESGSEEVRGDATTRYRVTLDPSMGEAGDWYDLDGEVEVWLDDQERLRRVRGGSIEMELWDFGVPVEVEPPADAVGIDEDPGALGMLDAPEVVGDWAVQAEGTTAGQAWQVFVAQASQAGTDLPCRTLELVGEDPGEAWFDDSFPMVHHDGALATCGTGGMGFGPGLGGGVADPALQVLTAGYGSYDSYDHDEGSGPPDLVAFAVSERFRSGPVRVVLDGADPVELPLDGTGLVVWAAETTDPVVAVELDGGAVRCPVMSFWDDAEGYDAPPAADALAVGTAPCVRV